MCWVIPLQRSRRFVRDQPLLNLWQFSESVRLSQIQFSLSRNKESEFSYRWPTLKNLVRYASGHDRIRGGINFVKSGTANYRCSNNNTSRNDCESLSNF
jgi:hypothetical protein